MSTASPLPVPDSRASIRLRVLAVTLVSFCGIAYEVMLTRYFAIASYTEFGYWVISMAMVGYGLSGVALSIFRGPLLKRSRGLSLTIALALMVIATAGFHYTTVNPFNPLALENPNLWQSELVNIGLYYLTLFPFFFLVGSFLGLSFMSLQESVMGLYAADLIGAGIGAVFMLALMYFLHPFYLVCAILPVLFLAGLSTLPGTAIRGKAVIVFLSLVMLAGCEYWLIFNNLAHFFEYKAVYTALHVEGNTVQDEIRSPKGYCVTLDNFTERRDLPLSNNLGLLNAEGPPQGLGLYRDGNRVTSLPKPGETTDLSYVDGALCTLPYVLRHEPRTLLVGAGGGFRLAEVTRTPLPSLVVLESDDVVFKNLGSASWRNTTTPASTLNAEIVFGGPQSYLAGHNQPFDVIDLSVEYLDGGHANIYAFTRDAIQQYYRALSDNGLVSIPISIRQFPGYAVKEVQTVVDAVTREGVRAPQDHILVYRSEWIARILLSRAPFSSEDLKLVRDFCDERSFDVSYFPGIVPEKQEVWNELPPFSIDDNAGAPSETKDALTVDLVKLFTPHDANAPEASAAAFDLGAVTNERPFLNSIVRPANFNNIMKHLDLLPQSEVGLLVNYAVLFQAVIFAGLVCLLPIAKSRSIKTGFSNIARSVVFAASLGMGFLLVEITLIERVSLILNDAVTAFAVVLSAMLVCSGLGSAFGGRMRNASQNGARLAVLAVAALTAVFWLAPGQGVPWLASLPLAAQYGVIVAAIAPVAFAMGMPFPAGLRSLEGEAKGLLPIVWGVNGAFSVIASPLAAILAFRWGYTLVLTMALGLYVIVWMMQPLGPKRPFEESR
ncbi:MAG: hypothetical protein HZB26_26525 [Candidatus Hydrogenedentes bacterium]|nr:hypothetical protein [Candidatus Hydrogenedentota bacterium]